MSTESFDPYHRWLGIPAKHQPPDHYRLLGIEQFEPDAEVIRDAADRQKLVNKLAALAERAEDPTEQFVLLRRASELASEAGDAGRVLELIDRIAGQFEVAKAA